MPNDEQMKHPGEQGFYGQNQQGPNSQPLSGPSSYTGPKAEYPDLSITNSPLPPPPPVLSSPLSPPVARYMNPPSPTPQDLERGLQERIGTNNQPPKQQNVWKIVSLVLLIIVVALASATAALVLTRPSSNSSSTVTNTAPGSSQPTSGPGQATTPTTASTTKSSTPTTASTTKSSTPTSSGQLVSDGTITENLQLTCGTNCSDPIHVTITTIQVSNGNGNMVWNISMQNVSGVSANYQIYTFELLASGSQNQIPATFPQSQSSAALANSDPLSIQGIFSFVPIQNTTYTLTAAMQVNLSGSSSNITFEPAQITNL